MLTQRSVPASRPFPPSPTLPRAACQGHTFPPSPRPGPSPFPRGALEEALRRLHVLDAIDADGDITQMGRRMAALPLEPALARALLAAHEFGWAAAA